MVRWRRRGDFAKHIDVTAQTGGPKAHEQDAIHATEEHDRSMLLLGVMMQVDTFLAGFLLFSLTGQKEAEEIQADEKVQVILQTVTFGVFLSAIIHTAVLMMSTGWRYTLTWYDPIFPGLFSALGLILLLVTVADAVLLELRPGDDINEPDYWLIVLLGLLLPVVLAGFFICIQMCAVK